MPGGLLPRWELNFPRGCVVVVRKMTMRRDLTSAPFNDKCALNCPLAVHVRVLGVPKSAAAGATARGRREGDVASGGEEREQMRRPRVAIP